MMLQSKNLGDLCKAILHESLPRNFQDAIEITRQLGLKYLWIDSLCTIQDSREDWATESSRMASVYQNALVTICAMSSPDSAHGILKTVGEADAIDSHAATQVPIDVSETGHSVKAHLFTPDVDEDLGRLSERAPLSRRCWCLQESMLSRRILCYGEMRIYWACGAGFRASDELPGPDSFPKHYSFGPAVLQDIMRTVVRPVHDRQQRQVLLETYASLVQNYSRRKVTFESDKLPAFSGIAKVFHPVMGGEYLAGIWSTDFNRGFCWSSAAGETTTRVDKYKAPSWSWASTDSHVWAPSQWQSATLT